MSENYPPSFEGTQFSSGDQIGLHTASDSLVSYEELVARREMEAALQAAAHETEGDIPLTDEGRSIVMGTNLAAVRSEKLGVPRSEFRLMSLRIRPAEHSADKDAA